MKRDEWFTKSDEWKDGWNAYAHDELFEDFESHSDDWKEGFLYAVHNEGLTVM